MSENILSPARGENESQEDYKNRRKTLNILMKIRQRYGVGAMTPEQWNKLTPAERDIWKSKI